MMKISLWTCHVCGEEYGHLIQGDRRVRVYCKCDKAKARDIIFAAIAVAVFGAIMLSKG